MIVTRVLVADDNAHAREAICDILSLDQTFDIISVATSGEQAIELTKRWLPELILMDVRMPGIGGLDAAGRIKLMFPAVKIVMITVSDDMVFLLEALKRGAQGYLLKNLSSSVWIEYLHSIMDEEVPLSKELAYQILNDFSLRENKEEPQVQLSKREHEILHGVAAGWTNRKIAETLFISEYTVKNHLKNILQKLQVQNRVQLTRYALEQGLIPNEKKE